MKNPIGQNIRKEREKRGISQEELGKAVSLTGASICRIETGVSDPSASTLEKIANYLGCNPVSFFMTDEQKKEKELATAFWKRINATLIKTGYTRKDIVERVPIEGKNLLFWERTSVLPSLEIVLRLAAFLNIDVYWLMYGDEIPNAEGMRKKLEKEYQETLSGAQARIKELEEELAQLKSK